MRQRNVNTETIIGRVYDHDLAIKTVQNQASENFGKPFIQGSVSVATDDAGLNVIPVHYTYVTEMTKAEKPNITYANLKRIMEGKTWVNDGADQATKVRLTPSIALNDFYPNGGDELVSQVRNEGGFVSIVNDLGPDNAKRREFKLDVVINNVELIENENEDYARIRCAAFNFRNALLPLTLVARDSVAPGSVGYFMGLDFSDGPIFTNVWGEIVNTTVKTERTVESAFGTPTVDISERTQREYVVTGAKPEPYVFGLEETITAEDLTQAIADRNVYLEKTKATAKEYYASRNAAAPASAIPTPAPARNAAVPAGQFNF
jgi:hypothetical protein